MSCESLRVKPRNHTGARAPSPAAASLAGEHGCGRGRPRAAHGGHEPGRAALLRRLGVWAERQLSPTRFMEKVGRKAGCKPALRWRFLARFRFGKY